MKTLSRLYFGCALAVMVGAPFAQGATPPKKVSPITVQLDGTTVAFPEAQPQVVMGRIMVPLRGLFEKMGCYVEYDAANHVITANYQNQSIVIRLGNKIANRNGAEILMEVPAVVINGNALVPLRFLAEAIGAKVAYDGPSNTVSITGNKSGIGSPPDPATTTGSGTR